MSNIKQDAHGSNINQAGRDIVIATPQPLNDESLVPCPECGHPISRFAHSCKACCFPVCEYFIEMERQEREKRLQIFCLAAMVIGFVLIVIIRNLSLPDKLETVMGWISGILLTLAFLTSSNRSRK